jgi:hypothetical protein
MALLSRGVDQGGVAGAVGAEQPEQLAPTYLRAPVTEDDGAHRQRAAFPGGFGERPRACLLATSGRLLFRRPAVLFTFLLSRGRRV